MPGMPQCHLLECNLARPILSQKTFRLMRPQHKTNWFGYQPKIEVLWSIGETKTGFRIISSWWKKKLLNKILWKNDNWLEMKEWVRFKENWSFIRNTSAESYIVEGHSIYKTYLWLSTAGIGYGIGLIFVGNSGDCKVL